MNCLSIIIPCYKDLNVENVIRSINYNEVNKKSQKIEVIIVVTDPQKELSLLLNSLRNEYKTKFSIKIVESKNPRNSNKLYSTTPYGGLARAYNKGIESSKFESVLIVDSDVIFEKNTLRYYLQRNKSFDVVKGKVKFGKPNSFGQWLTNQARKANTSDYRALYTPSLLIKKSILIKLKSDKFYSEWVPYSTDSEFGDRIFNHNKKILLKHKINFTDNEFGFITNHGDKNIVDKIVAKDKRFITILFEDNASVKHEAYSLGSDIKCAIKFGIDTFYFVQKNGIKTKFIENILYYMKQGIKTKNPLVFFYMNLWYHIQIISYYHEKFKFFLNNLLNK